MTLDQVRAEILKLARSDRPIIVGPWLSEVGFELLYWIPFLRRIVAEGQIAPERLWVLSRGGCRSWYADITANYLELYDLYTTEQLRKLNQHRVNQQTDQALSIGMRRGQVTAKQLFVSKVEAAMVAKAAQRAGLESPAILHPSLMYQAFRPVWKHRSRDLFGAWRKMTLGDRMAAPVATLSLPERYLAVKFYASQALPDKPAAQMHVQKMIRLMAETIPVVLLHTRTAYDEHGEFAIPTHPNVQPVAVRAETNLETQTEVIARSSVFVGTYGGFAYLAPFLGISTLAFFADPNFRRDHLSLMKTVASHRLKTDFRVLDVTDGTTAIRQDRSRWMAHAA